MFIIYDMNDEAITICSSEKSLAIAEKSLVGIPYYISKWDDCPQEISDYLSRDI